MFINGQLYQSPAFDIPSIVDRVGGGDAFASGVLHGLLSDESPQTIIDFANLATAMKHTVHGDVNQFSVEEIQLLMKNGTKEIKR